jgi:hypothetical protein
MHGNFTSKKACALYIASTLCFSTLTQVRAQDTQARPPEAPVPGGSSLPPVAPSAASAPEAASAPVSNASAPVPGAQDAQGTNVPARLTSVVSVHDAQIWLARFKNQCGSPSPQLLEQLAMFYEWLLELLDEHNRLATVFNKNESTKSISETEKQTVTKLVHLKNEVLLLKANLLIKLNRYAEAILPLVDVVNAEPLSTAGKEAYKNLQDIGFSDIPDVSRQSVNSSDASLETTSEAQTVSTSITPPKTTAKTQPAKANRYAAVKTTKRSYYYRIR